MTSFVEECVVKHVFKKYLALRYSMTLIDRVCAELCVINSPPVGVKCVSPSFGDPSIPHHVLYSGMWIEGTSSLAFGMA